MSRLGDFSPVDVMTLTAAELSGRINMTDRAAKIFTGLKKEFDAREAEKQLEHRGIEFVTPDDEDYPVRLAGLPDLPPALYLQGRLPEGPAVALVGSRKASSTGLDTAQRLGEALRERGVCVVSGLALGIDAAAHQGALAGEGPTVGVLGCGIDVADAHTDQS